MKILIWSDRDELLSEIVWKLHKEKHEVYVVFNERQKDYKKINGVFEEYYMFYESNHISTVVRNVAPDICLFLQDVIPRINDRKSYVTYITGLTNAIMSAKHEGVRKFFYRSSVQVYRGIKDEIINEKTLPQKGNEEIDKILFCEQLCRMNKDEFFNPVILRFSEIIQSKFEVGPVGYVSSYIYAFWKGKTVHISEERFHNCIYVKDACEALYRLLMVRKHTDEVQVIASKESYDEKTIAYEIYKHLPTKLDLQLDKPEDATVNYRFESTLLNDFGFKQKYTLKKAIEIMAQGITKAEWKKNTNKKRRKFWMPYIETTVFFIIVQLFALATSNADFHLVIDVYLIYSLWAATIYGVGGGITAVILSILARSFMGVNCLELSGMQFYYWCVQLLTLTVLGGCIKDRFKRIEQDYEDSKDYLKYELDYYKQLNENSQEIKKIYEERLLNYKDSFAKIADIISGLDELEAQKVIFEAVGVIERALDSKKVCVYLVDEESGFARLMASSNCFDGKGKTFNIKDYPEQLEVLKSGEVYVNREMNGEWPIMMKAINSNGNINAIVMVYDLDFKSMGLHTANTFSVLCNLIEGSMRRAYIYLTGIRESLYYGDSHIMKWEAFEDILELYVYGEAKNLQEFTLIELTITNSTEEEIQNTVRKTDYLGKKDDEHCYIILSNTKEDDAQFVLERYEQANIPVEIVKKRKGINAKEVFPSVI